MGQHASIVFINFRQECYLGSGASMGGWWYNKFHGRPCILLTLAASSSCGSEAGGRPHSGKTGIDRRAEEESKKYSRLRSNYAMFLDQTTEKKQTGELSSFQKVTSALLEQKVGRI